MVANSNGIIAKKPDKAKKVRGIGPDGWFTETATMWPGQKFSLKLEDSSSMTSSILFHEESEYQEILVFKSAQYGKVFAIDGILQLTERDAFAFHETMSHLPLFSHLNPEHVLIVGGGDGIVLQEVCRHKEVKKVTLVEIDPLVIHASKEYLKLVPPELYDDPRVEIIHGDAAEYIQDPANHNKFDVILADTLDPLGPAESLFEPEFYEHMHDALRPNGIVCTQGENMWIHFELIRDLVSCCKDIFGHAEYATTSVPSYPCGQIGFIVARKGKDNRSCNVPVRTPTPAFQSQLKWYNPQMHRAAFALPQYVHQELNGEDSDNNTDHNKNANATPDFYRDDNNGDEEGDRCILSQCVIS
jgi:spermidine synthase